MLKSKIINLAMPPTYIPLAVEQDGAAKFASRVPTTRSRELTNLECGEDELLLNAVQSRRRRVLPAVAVSSLLVLAVGSVAVLSRNSAAATAHGLDEVMSAFAVCSTDAPLRLSLSVNSSAAGNCNLSHVFPLEGVWTYDNWTTRHGVKFAKYMMTEPGKNYHMYLDTCAYGSHANDQSSCASRWVVNDPLIFAQTAYNSMQLTPGSVMSTTACTSVPSDKPIAPPLGPARWVVDCQNGFFKHFEVTLAEARLVVEGQWQLQVCGAQGVTQILNMSSGLSTSTGAPIDEAAAKADILLQMDRGSRAAHVVAQGAQQSMVDILTQQFKNALNFSHPGNLAMSLTPASADVCYWVWKWSITGPVAGDSDARLQLLSQSAHAWTPSRAAVPLCYPGFATDFPRYQACSPNHTIPTSAPPPVNVSIK